MPSLMNMPAVNSTAVNTAADSFSLAGKVAIVTGSARENGIGAATARALARNGAYVAINYVSESSAQGAYEVAQSIRDEYGVRTACVQGDVSTPKGSRKIVVETMEQLGVNYIDILVNNAGYAVTRLLRETDFELCQRTFATNVYGQLFMTQAAIDLGRMPPGGRIINIGSIASKIQNPLVGIYAASKAAQDSLTTSWAGELGRTHGITVNTVAPGPVVTDITKDSPEVLDPLVRLQRGTGRRGAPEDIADVVLLLASEKSRWITGQFIAADAGITGSR
ncbi:putative short-chain dehydrogenase [Daldinia eschscholtzii]|nr:putative short-chain dehydrogenase [Daldinia eschscholtzii]